MIGATAANKGRLEIYRGVRGTSSALGAGVGESIEATTLLAKNNQVRLYWNSLLFRSLVVEVIDSS